MSARVRLVLAATAVAALLTYGLSGHGAPQMSDHDGLGGTAVGVCLLLACALGLASTPRLEAPHASVARQAVAIAVDTPPPAPLDRRARASPSALQRFRN